MRIESALCLESVEDGGSGKGVKKQVNVNYGGEVLQSWRSLTEAEDC